MMNYLMSFISCGIICLLAQQIINFTKLSPGHVTSLFVIIGVILEFFGVYDVLRTIGAVGMSVPISNFGALMFKGVKEAIVTDGVLGIATGIFQTTSGAVTMAIFLSCLASFIVKPKL